MLALRQCERTELVAIAESNPQRLNEAAKQFGISATYSDYTELIACDNIDTVSIALPDFLRAMRPPTK